MGYSTLYDLIGGASAVHELVNNFIDEITLRPGMEHLRALYVDVDMNIYRVRLEEFLSGWLGGPALYLQRHGIPMLRENHRNIAINDLAAEQWMACMRAALDATIADIAIRLKVEGAFMRMAESLKNSH